MANPKITVENMSWTLLLEDENADLVRFIGAQASVELIFDDLLFLQKTRLLRYLDSYGDTVFNRLQMEDLISDIKFAAECGKIDCVLAEKMEILARCCKEEHHIYLRFAGD